MSIQNIQSVTSSNSLENTFWYMSDGEHFFPLNPDGTLCMCLHDDKQKCTCVCHKEGGHT